METCREERRGEEAPDPLHTGRFIPVIIYDAHYLLGHPNPWEDITQIFFFFTHFQMDRCVVK